MTKTSLCILDEIFEISNLLYCSKLNEEAIGMAKPHIKKLKKAINIPERELIYFTLIFSGILSNSQNYDSNQEYNSEQNADFKINLLCIAKFLDISPIEILKDYNILKNLYDKNLYHKRKDEENDLNFFFNDELTMPQEIFSAVIENDCSFFKNISVAGGLKSRNFILPSEIKEKQLFFEGNLAKQINFISQAIEEETFSKLKKKLADEKINTGVCVLFYGSPGTGKTESVMQIAKNTGRAIFSVDISAQRSMWWGESEKLTQKIFTDYKQKCETAKKNHKPMPILFFNEADAIFSKRRTDSDFSITETENTIQNIILENMERLDGILFATTNLSENFDKAFERRFLFKVKFEKPTIETAAKIWQSKLRILNVEQAMELADKYDFSGGEIDNIARKIIIDKVLSDEDVSFDALKEFCEQERLDSEKAVPIGFGVKQQ